jgi:uncharacterized protein
MKRLFIVHGWAGSHDEPFYIYLKKELEKKDFEIYPLKMPKVNEPQINEWVSTLSKAVYNVDENTYLYGHSIGSQTILRYLETLSPKKMVGGVIFTAGFVHLKPATFEGPWKSSKESARPWLETPLNWEKIRKHIKRAVAIFSDDDPFVPLSDKEIFKKELNAKIIIEHNKMHSPGSESVLKEIYEMAK